MKNFFCFSFVQTKIFTARNSSENFNLPYSRINPPEYWDEKKSLLTLGYHTKSCDDQCGPSTSYDCNKECDICFSNTEGFRLLSCGHYFCQPCWREYCTEKIHSNRVPITCPQSKCNAVVDYNLLTTFIPLSQCELYANQLRNLEILTCSNQFIWCPTPNCRLLHFPQPSK